MDNRNGVRVVSGREEDSCPGTDRNGLSRRQALGALASAAAAAGIAGAPAAAAPKRPVAPAGPAAKKAFIDDLIARMTVDEKVGQLRLISIGPEMPHAKLVEEVAAGRIAGSFNTVVRRDNRPLQEAAVKRSRLKIPLFFAISEIA